MRKVRLGFGMKSSLVASLVLFVIILSIVSFSINLFYGIVQNYIENLLEVINAAFEKDYFQWMRASIDDFSSTMLSLRVDELKFFEDNIKSALIRESSFATYTNVSEYILSPFYWSGSSLYIVDKTLWEEVELLNFLKKEVNILPPGERRYFITKNRNRIAYICRVRNGAIGADMAIQNYGKAWVKSTFKGALLDFYLSVSFAGERGNKGVEFAKVIDEISGDKVDINAVYRELKKKAIAKGKGVASAIIGNLLAFLVERNYGDFEVKEVLVIPVNDVFPMDVWRLALLITVPVVGIIFVLMFIVNSRVFRRIRELSDKIGELGRSGGDLSFRIKAAVDIREVREIVENFNDFLDAVESVVKKTKETFRDIEENIEVLKELEEEVDDIREVIKSQEEVRQMMEEVSAMSNEVSATVEEMFRSVDVIRGNVEKQYNMIEEMSGMIEETIMTVNNVGRRIGKADEILSKLREDAMRSSIEVKKNVEEVRDVNMFLSNVLEVVDVIKVIADRIEILSMNAGIEAAHAGESGKGFAVVAEEMGNLAEDSRKKAEEVEKLVNDVISRVKSGVEKVEENSERFIRIADGIKEISMFVSEINASMIDVGKTSEMVMKAIASLTEYSEGIKVAMEESRTGMEEVAKAIYEVGSAAGKLNERFSEVYGILKDAVDLLTRVSEKLPGIIQSLKALGEDLKKFKVTEMRFSKGITLAE